MVEVSTLLLLKEAQDLFDDGNTDDALAVARAVVDADPSFPDVWIDIAAMLRAKAAAGSQPDAMERQALDADRQLVALGGHIPDLAAAVAVARAHISHREGWDRHLASHVAAEQQHATEEAARRTRAAAEAAEHKAKVELLHAEERDRISREIAEANRELAKAEKRVKPVKLTRQQKKWASKWENRHLVQVVDTSPEAILAARLREKVSDLRSSLAKVGTWGPTDLPPMTPLPAAIPTRPSASQFLKNFDSMRRSGHSCECGARLDGDPPPPLASATSPSPSSPPPPPPPP